jgi:hypothetical protein
VLHCWLLLLVRHVLVLLLRCLLLEAHKVQGGRWAATHDANALRHGQYRLKLRDVPRIQLQGSGW